MQKTLKMLLICTFSLLNVSSYFQRLTKNIFDVSLSIAYCHSDISLPELKKYNFFSQNGDLSSAVKFNVILFFQEMLPKYEFDKLMEKHSKDILIVQEEYE